MSLRHLFPECDLPDYRLAVEPGKSPNLPRKPNVVKFRPGKDPSEVAAELVGYTYSQLEASVGAGKSTAIPAALCKAMGKPVVHLVPHRLLAVDLYGYLKTRDFGVEYKCMRDPAEEFVPNGVTITTYACLVAKLIIGRQSKAPLGEVVLYADESHESDAYTYVVSKLGPSIGGIVAYISATATPDAQRFPMRETKGEVVSKKLPKVPSHQWNPLDAGQPWSISSQTGNALLFIDNDKTADILVGAYNAGGATAYRLASKMDEDLFVEAMKNMRDPKSGIIVMIADYSFRNGFDFEVDTIIDSGEVKFVDVLNGSKKLCYRAAYELENYQAMGRGARHTGENVTCWNPDIKLKPAICMLEGVEMEVAAVLFRVLGYAVPTEIKALAVFSAGLNVPSNLPDSFNTFIPLTIQSSDVMMPLVYERPPTPEGAVAAEDVLDSYTESPVESKVDYFVGEAAKETPGPKVRELNSDDFLQELAAISSAASTLEWPNYYGCHGLVLKSMPIPRYGDDWRQAVSDVLTSEHVVHSLTPMERHDIIGVLLLHYNRCVSQVAAAHRLSGGPVSLKRLSAEHPEIVKRWVDWVTSHIRENEAMGKSTLKAVTALRLGAMHFVSVAPDEEYEKDLAKDMASMLMSVVSKARGLVDAGSIFGAMKSLDEGGGGSFPGSVRMLTASGAGKQLGDTIRAVVRPVRLGSQQLYDFTLYADNSIMLSTDDYIFGLTSLMGKLGYSISNIRKLVLHGSKVKPNVVLQTLKDRGIAKHRARNEYTVQLLPSITGG